MDSNSDRRPRRAEDGRMRHRFPLARQGEPTPQISGNALEIPQGSLYPALYGLEHQGQIAPEWGPSENNRRARYYTLTAAGRRRLRFTG
jgi:DNA-binding MarR family transcriptional regulator